MGIESGPKWIPEDNVSKQEPPQPPVDKTDKKDYWSHVDAVLQKQRQEALARMSLEEREKALEQNKTTKQQTEEIRKWKKGEQAKGDSPNKLDMAQQPPSESEGGQLTQQKLDVNQAQQQMDKENERLAENIREQEYQRVKEQMRQFREKHGINKTSDELVAEDLKLKKSFGLE